MISYHGPGDPLDKHNLDPNAHGGAFLPVASTAGPTIIAPPGSVIAASGVSAWYGANAATLMRFNVPVRKAYRYINLYVGASSGNIQVGVASVAPSSDTAITVSRVMHSGVIACPAANAPARIDCGSTMLEAGDYVLFLWCDNTTASFLHGLASGLTASRLLFSSSPAGGVGTLLTTGVTTRWVSGLTLESI